MLKISTRISLLYFFSTAVIIAIMAFSMYFIYHNQGLKAIDDELHDYAHFLTSGQDFENNDAEYIFKELTERREKSKQKIIFDYNFILIVKDSVIFQPGEPFYLEDIIDNIMAYDEKDMKNAYVTLNVNGQDFRIYEYKLDGKKQGGEFDIIMVASLNKFNESLTQITYILFVVSPLLLIIAALIGYFITKRALSSVRQMSRIAESITGKNLDGRVPVPNADDELAELARTLNDMIERLQKTINAQKQFIADASHDFRTPLAIIRLELELLEERKDIGDDVRHSIETSIREIKTLSTMAENLLILARADSHQLSLNKTEFRLDELIMETAADFNKMAVVKGISFNIGIDELAEIQADRDMLKRIFTNSIDNAIKYSPENRIIKIELKVENGKAVVVIVNEGKDLTQEELASIFSRFQRLDKSRTSKGFGLGMPIIKTIVETHGGTVEFLSEKGLNKLIITLQF
jgi:heavy metal sensor kinase